MKITKETLKRIDTPEIRMKIAIELKCSEMTIRRYIDDNNDSLTKAAALKVIRAETGLTDAEILIEPQHA